MKDIKISLAAARVNAGLTQVEVANDLRISKKTLINWEKGKARPSFATIRTLSNLYKMPVDNIFLPKNTT